MSPYIWRYRNPRALLSGELPFAGTVITAQRSMALLFRKHHVPSFDVDMILRVLLPDWYDRTRFLRQYLLIRRSLAEVEEIFAPEIANAFRNNIREVLRGLRTFVEIGVPAKTLPKRSPEEELFQYLYETFLTDREGGVVDLKKRLRDWNDPVRFAKLLETVQFPDGLVMGVPDRTYFQGFYYIRPMAGRLMEAFDKLKDVRLYFVNAFDEKCAEQYEVWTKNPRFAKLEVVETAGTAAEGAEEPKFVCFKDVFSMVHWLRTTKEKPRLFAPMSTPVRDILDTFFPKTEEKESLLASPAGRYLQILYAMRDAAAKDWVLQPELLRESLATGWPCYGEKESPEHFLGVFDRVGHFFSDCRKTEDWLRRQSDLVERTRRFAKQQPEAAQPSYSERWNKLITNPLGGIGALSVPEKDVAALFRVIRGMIDDAEALHAGVDDKGEVNFLEHFGRIQRLLEKRAAGKKISPEDQRVMSFLEKRFSRARPEIQSCRVDDLANVMPFFLGGKLLLEDEEDIPEYSKVYGLTDVESAHLDKRNAETLFCFFDANSLPFPPREYDWPMTPEYVRAIRLPKDAQETRKRLDDLCYYVESVVLSSRYLFHLAQTLPKPMFSWIESKQGKEVQPSPYLELLGGGALTQRTVYVDHLLMGEESFKGKVPKKPSWWDMNAAVENHFVGGSSQPVDVLASRAACPKAWRRLWYDYGVCERPVFSADFHLQFAVSLWIAIRAVTHSKGTNAAAWEVYLNYPVFSRSKQAEIADFAAKYTNKLKNYNSKHWKIIPYRIFLSLLLVKPTINFLEHGRLEEKEVSSLCTLCLHRNLCRGLIRDPIE